MRTAVIVGGSRTPIGKYMGAFATVPAVELGGKAIKAAVASSQVSLTNIDQVIMGQVVTAGCGQIPARQAAILAGIPWSVPAVTVNKVCLSGLTAIGLAAQMIQSGAAKVVIAGGQESMSQAPFIVPSARKGLGFGNATLLDALYFDGLRDSYSDESMGLLTEKANTKYGFTREKFDQYAVSSHRRAAQAWKAGAYTDEVCPVDVRGPKKSTVTVSQDEGFRAEIDEAKLQKLPAAFTEDGLITAGNASPLSDGAAALVIVDKDYALEAQLEIWAEISSYATVAGPDATLQLQPSTALKKALQQTHYSIDDLDHIEINEAFSAVSLASEQDLDCNSSCVNPHGGAIALGHPLGMSGARLALHCASLLRAKKSSIAGAALCGGGGQGDAMIFTNTY